MFVCRINIRSLFIAQKLSDLLTMQSLYLVNVSLSSESSNPHQVKNLQDLQKLRWIKSTDVPEHAVYCESNENFTSLYFTSLEQ